MIDQGSRKLFARNTRLNRVQQQHKQGVQHFARRVNQVELLFHFWQAGELFQAVGFLQFVVQ
jgi:hypothetical protein